MARSVSWVMGYHRRPRGERDRVGGLPDHLPPVWPVCQLCQQAMAFAGQLYSSDRWHLGGPLALHIYVCDDCRQSYGSANDRLPIQLVSIPSSATENAPQEGVKCRRQPRRYISYTPIMDSIDQWTFNRRKLTEVELPDEHLRRDKVGGLFPYDGSEGPRITPANRMVAQFTWAAVGGPVYLYHSIRRGLYLYHYR